MELLFTPVAPSTVAAGGAAAELELAAPWLRLRPTGGDAAARPTSGGCCPKCTMDAAATTSAGSTPRVKKDGDGCRAVDTLSDRDGAE